MSAQSGSKGTSECISMIWQWLCSPGSSTRPIGSWRASKRMKWLVVSNLPIYGVSIRLFIMVLLGFIDWAKQQIESYAEMFRKQVYSSDVEQKTVDEALNITYSQSKKVRLFLLSLSMHSFVNYSCYKSMASTSVSSSMSSSCQIPRRKPKLPSAFQRRRSRGRPNRSQRQTQFRFSETLHHPCDLLHYPRHLFALLRRHTNHPLIQTALRQYVPERLSLLRLHHRHPLHH